MTELKAGDAVEYFEGDKAFEPMLGAIGVVSKVEANRWGYVTWISVPAAATQYDFVRNGSAEHWQLVNLRKLGELEVECG